MNGPHLRLSELLSLHNEWITVREDGRVFSLRRHEMELSAANGAALFGFLDRDGYSICRLEAAEFDEQKALLTLSRRFGADRFRLELIPRTTLAELDENIELARLAAANRFADAVSRTFRGSKVKRVFLNRPGGRFAHIVLDRGPLGEQGIVSDAAGSGTPERLISAAVLWLERIANSKKNRIRKIYVLAGKGKLAPVRRLHACLAPHAARKIGILAIKPFAAGESVDEAAFSVSEAAPISIDDLWKGKPAPLIAPEEIFKCKAADALESLDPEKIDRVFSRHGITLRYLGLSFARFRRVKGTEKGWFGVNTSRSILDGSSKDELADLISKLSQYRKHDSPNKQHLFYQACREAWLESLLRRNVRRLDPNLVLSPIYNQFRTSRDRIDLLALRSDGRLVIIELKVSPDNGMVFQAVDYWRRIERQRRSGALKRAGLFGTKEIADKPALVYLAAPSLCFTRQTDVLAEAVSREIGILQFELSEEWMRELKVLRIVERE